MCGKKELQLKIKQWQDMPRNNQVELAEADRYFDEVLMPVSLDMFLAKEAERRGEYAGMVLTLGTSWQPLALSISAMLPQKVLLLGTEDTQKYVEQIKAFVNESTIEYEFRQVDRSSAKDIYTACREWCATNSQLGKIAADITGGTKAMVSALTMYAALQNLDIYYVESKYLPLYRRPEPGSEELILLPLPK